MMMGWWWDDNEMMGWWDDGVMGWWGDGMMGWYIPYNSNLPISTYSLDNTIPQLGSFLYDWKIRDCVSSVSCHNR